MARARRRLPRLEQELAPSLAGAAYDAAKADEQTTGSAKRWRTCMEPYGISDLPEAPHEMPSRSMEERFGLMGSGARVPTSTSQGSASPEEIRVATGDAKCRQSSGYAKALYEAEVSQQSELIASNRDALERARAANARHAKRVRSVIASSGGG